MFDFLPKDVQVTEEDLDNTPPAVLQRLFAMAEEISCRKQDISSTMALGLLFKGETLDFAN